MIFPFHPIKYWMKWWFSNMLIHVVVEEEKKDPAPLFQ